MAYSDDTEFPRGIFHSAAIAAPTVVVAAGVQVKVKEIVLHNGSGAPVTFVVSSGGGGLTYYLLPAVPAGATVRLPGFHSSDGLRVLGAASCTATVIYFTA